VANQRACAWAGTAAGASFQSDGNKERTRAYYEPVSSNAAFHFRIRNLAAYSYLRLAGSQLPMLLLEATVACARGI
jgi:hypothetical protein